MFSTYFYLLLSCTLLFYTFCFLCFIPIVFLHSAVSHIFFLCFMSLVSFAAFYSEVNCKPLYEYFWSNQSCNDCYWWTNDLRVKAMINKWSHSDKSIDKRNPTASAVAKVNKSNKLELEDDGGDEAIAVWNSRDRSMRTFDDMVSTKKVTLSTLISSVNSAMIWILTNIETGIVS